MIDAHEIDADPIHPCPCTRQGHVDPRCGWCAGAGLLYILDSDDLELLEMADEELNPQPQTIEHHYHVALPALSPIVLAFAAALVWIAFKRHG